MSIEDQILAIMEEGFDPEEALEEWLRRYDNLPPEDRNQYHMIKVTNTLFEWRNPSSNVRLTF